MEVNMVLVKFSSKDFQYFVWLGSPHTHVTSSMTKEKVRECLRRMPKRMLVGSWPENCTFNSSHILAEPGLMSQNLLGPKVSKGFLEFLNTQLTDTRTVRILKRCPMSDLGSCFIIRGSLCQGVKCSQKGCYWAASQIHLIFSFLCVFNLTLNCE